MGAHGPKEGKSLKYLFIGPLSRVGGVISSVQIKDPKQVLLDGVYLCALSAKITAHRAGVSQPRGDLTPPPPGEEVQPAITYFLASSQLGLPGGGLLK